MMVGNMKSCSHVLVKTVKCILFPQYFGAHNRSEFYVQHINCNTYKKVIVDIGEMLGLLKDLRINDGKY